MVPSRVFWVLVGAQFLALSCSSNQVGLPAATGITQNLTRNAGTTLYWVDEIGGIGNPYGSKSIRVSAVGEFTARGWAVDKQSQTPAGGVDIVLDNIPYGASYGLDRLDVADGQKVAAYRQSGWQFSMPASRLKGTHALTVRIVSNDRKSYYEIPTLTLSVE